MGLDNISIRKLFFSAVFYFSIVFSVYCQLPPPPPPPTTSQTPPCWPPPCIPIDGGVSFLAVAGAAYAGKKLYNRVKKK